MAGAVFFAQKSLACGAIVKILCCIDDELGLPGDLSESIRRHGDKVCCYWLRVGGSSVPEDQLSDESLSILNEARRNWISPNPELVRSSRVLSVAGAIST